MPLKPLNVENFARSFEQLELPSKLKADFVQFQKDGTPVPAIQELRAVGNFEVFYNRILDARRQHGAHISDSRDKAEAAWNLMCDALERRDVPTAERFLAALVDIGFDPLDKDEGRFFWSGMINKKGALGHHLQPLNTNVQGLAHKPYTPNAVPVPAKNDMFSPQDRGMLASTGATQFPASLEGSQIPGLLDDLQCMGKLDWSVTLMVWGVLSRMFALGARGRVIVSVLDGLMVGSVFWNDELPALRLVQRTFPERIEGIYIKIYSTVENKFGPLLSLDDHFDDIHVTSRRNWRVDENAGGNRAVIDGIGVPVRDPKDWQPKTGLSLGVLQRVCRAAQHETLALPEIRKRLQVQVRLERDGVWTRQMDIGERDTFLVRLTHAEDPNDKTILVRPMLDQGPSASGADKLRAMASNKGRVHDQLEKIELWLSGKYPTWAALPRHIEVRAHDCVIVDNMVRAEAATLSTGRWFYKDADAPKPAPPAGWQYGKPYVFLPTR